MPANVPVTSVTVPPFGTLINQVLVPSAWDSVSVARPPGDVAAKRRPRSNRKRVHPRAAGQVLNRRPTTNDLDRQRAAVHTGDTERITVVIADQGIGASAAVHRPGQAARCPKFKGVSTRITRETDEPSQRERHLHCHCSHH